MRAAQSADSALSRRDFLKFCSAVATAIGLGPQMGSRVAAAFAAGNRPVVLWLHFSECTGCTEAVLRTMTPYFDDLLFDSIALDYHETLMAGAGETVEHALSASASANAGAFFCVVEGSIPTAENGAYGTIGGRTMLSIAEEICPKAKAIIALGTCGAYGGLAAAAPNPTGAKGVRDALPSLSVPVINMPGCPPNPITFAGVLATYLLQNTLLPLDAIGRPLFAYEQTVHSRCPYSSGSGRNRCVHDDGCKGYETHNNCPTVKFNDGVSFPMQAGHPCIGCAEPGFWDTMSPFYKLYASSIGDAAPVRAQTPLDDTRDMFDLRGRKVAQPRAARTTAATPGAPVSSGTYITKQAGRKAVSLIVK